MELVQKKCKPCDAGVPPWTREQIKKYLPHVSPGWEVIDDKKIKRKFQFGSFKEALDFVNRVADRAEVEGHHPNIHIYYNKVVIDLTTHVIKGLSENDFILASKIDLLS